MTKPARVSDTHDCPCGCGGQVPRRMFACKPGWFRLPKEIRDRIWSAHRAGLAGKHRDAMAAAMIWYRANPR